MMASLPLTSPNLGILLMLLSSHPRLPSHPSQNLGNLPKSFRSHPVLSIFTTTMSWALATISSCLEYQTASQLASPIDSSLSLHPLPHPHQSNLLTSEKSFENANVRDDFPAPSWLAWALSSPCLFSNPTWHQLLPVLPTQPFSYFPVPHSSQSLHL